MKTLLKALLIIVLNHAMCNSAYSQPFALQNGVFPTQSFDDLKWGDFDKEGDLDYIVVYCTGVYPDVKWFIKVFENQGKGSFTEAVSIPTLYGGNSISWFDYDKDRDLDIIHISGAFGSNGVEIFRNNGTKAFSKIADSFVDEYDGNNVVDDLNNDGYPDILYNGHSTNKTYFYLNNGNSTFRSVANHSIIGLCYGSIDCGDFDRNGYKDILISGLDYLSEKDCTKVYKNNGNNTFSEIVFSFTGVSNTSGVRGTPSRWGDYDNDGDIDVVQVGNGYIFLYDNKGNGTFGKHDSIAVANISNGSISLGDYDNDGDSDLLVSGTKGFSTSRYKASKVFNNDGSGGFVEDLSISLSDQVSGITQWVDYDGDGDLDILLNGMLYRNDRVANSLHNSSVVSDIKLYPNPTNEFLYIQGVQSKSELTINDISGKVIEVIKPTGDQIKIGVAHLSSGLYYVHLKDGFNNIVKKFLKI